jgi:hypothetical protein
MTFWADTFHRQSSSCTTLDGSDEERVEVYHAWIVEDLDGGRVRILTQEIRLGSRRPNKMLLGHLDWLDGLVKAARGEKIKDTN